MDTPLIPVGKDHEGRVIYAFVHSFGVEYGVTINGVFWFYWDLSLDSYLG